MQAIVHIAQHTSNKELEQRSEYLNFESFSLSHILCHHCQWLTSCLHLPGRLSHARLETLVMLPAQKLPCLVSAPFRPLSPPLKVYSLSKPLPLPQQVQTPPWFPFNSSSNFLTGSEEETRMRGKEDSYHTCCTNTNPSCQFLDLHNSPHEARIFLLPIGGKLKNSEVRV